MEDGGVVRTLVSNSGRRYNSLAEPQGENKVTRFRIVAKVVHSPWDLAGSGGDRVRVRHSFGLRRWPVPAKRCRGGSIRR